MHTGGPERMDEHCAWLSPWRSEEGSRPLELWMVVSHPVDAEDRTWILCKSSKALKWRVTSLVPKQNPLRHTNMGAGTLVPVREGVVASCLGINEVSAQREGPRSFWLAKVEKTLMAIPCVLTASPHYSAPRSTELACEWSEYLPLLSDDPWVVLHEASFYFTSKSSCCSLRYSDKMADASLACILEWL